MHTTTTTAHGPLPPMDVTLILAIVGTATALAAALGKLGHSLWMAALAVGRIESDLAALNTYVSNHIAHKLDDLQDGQDRLKERLVHIEAKLPC